MERTEQDIETFLGLLFVAFGVFLTVVAVVSLLIIIQLTKHNLT